MRIDAEEERPVDALLAAIEADRLSDRKDVGFVERSGQRRAAMTGRAEGNLLSAL